MNPKAKNELINNYFNCLDSGQYSGLYDILTNNVHFSYPNDNTYHSLDKVVYFMENEKETRSTKHKINRLTHNPDLTICEGTVSAIKRNKKHSDIKFVDIFEFDNGKISSIDIYVK